MSSDLHVLVEPTESTPGYQRGFVPSSTLSAAQISTLVTDSQQQIIGFWPVVSTEVILRSGRKVTGMVVKGVTNDRMERLRQQITESADPQLMTHPTADDRPTLAGILLGQELAYEMGLIPGDEVTLVSPTETEGPFDNIPRLKKYVLEGIYHSGLPEQELHTAFAREDDVRSFLRKSQVVSHWEITVKDFNRAPEVAAHIRELYPHLKVQDWIQLNSHLFASLRLERFSMFIILAFIIIVASFNIVTTLTLMVLEKKREISIFKAMGARNGQVAAIFLAEGLFIGTLGVGGGAAFGFLVCSLLRRYEFITLPDIYYDRTLPVTFDPRYYVLVSLAGLVIVLIACIYPSKRAAKLHPLDGIRFGG